MQVYSNCAIDACLHFCHCRDKITKSRLLPYNATLVLTVSGYLAITHNYVSSVFRGTDQSLSNSRMIWEYAKSPRVDPNWCKMEWVSLNSRDFPLQVMTLVPTATWKWNPECIGPQRHVVGSSRLFASSLLFCSDRRTLKCLIQQNGIWLKKVFRYYCKAPSACTESAATVLGQGGERETVLSLEGMKLS